MESAAGSAITGSTINSPAPAAWTYTAARGLALACLYFAVGLLGLLLAFGFGRTQIVWSSSGIAFAGLALFGLRYWPAIFVADALLSFAAGYPPIAGIGLTTGKVAEAVLGVWIYGRYSGRRRSFRSVRDVLAFVAAAAISTVAGACVGTFAIQTGGAESPGGAARLWGNWTFGDLISDLVLAPFLLIIASRPWRLWPRNRRIEAVLLLLTLVCVAGGVFSRRLVLDQLLIPFTFPLFPLLIWAALRFEQAGAAAASLFIAFLSLFTATRGAGAFQQQEFNHALFIVHGYMFVITVSAYCLGAAVTGRRLAEEHALRLTEQLRALSHRLDEAREEERVHLARELHDQLGQQLTGLGLAVAALTRKLPPGTDAVRIKASEIEDILRDTIGTVQRIATELRPGVINELSLHEALQWLAEKFARDTGIPVRFRNDAGALELPPDAKLAIFRIFQEAIANVARHAHATAALLEIRLETGKMAISLQDDGIGVSDSAKSSTNSLGFIGMRERALGCGAELRIANAPFLGSAERPGTLVEVILSFAY